MIFDDIHAHAIPDRKREKEREKEKEKERRRLEDTLIRLLSRNRKIHNYTRRIRIPIRRIEARSIRNLD